MVIRRLRRALDAATDVGIYPRRIVGGDAPYDKRTEYMEGWNAASITSVKKVTKMLSDGDWK